MEMPWYLEPFKQAIETLDSNNDTLEWLGKNCKDCGNEKCKKLGTLPKGYSCALWQPKARK